VLEQGFPYQVTFITFHNARIILMIGLIIVIILSRTV